MEIIKQADLSQPDTFECVPNGGCTCYHSFSCSCNAAMRCATHCWFLNTK